MSGLLTAAVQVDDSASIGEVAYGALLADIETCALPPGSPINERAEAARRGMSRTPFREALHRLAQDGLVVSVPKRGTYVAPLDAADIRDNMAVRLAVETEMATRLASGDVAFDLAFLKACLAAQDAALRAGDCIAFLRADDRFHLAILEAAGNRRATAAVRRASIHVNRARYMLPMSATQMRAAVRGHREMLAGLVERDPAATRDAIARHLDEPLMRRLQELRKRQPDAFRPATGSDEGLRSTVPEAVSA
ncbi:MAG: GntR family transcriptional regulator [Candidatus Dormibacteria bacterium]